MPLPSSTSERHNHRQVFRASSMLLAIIPLLLASLAPAQAAALRSRKHSIITAHHIVKLPKGGQTKTKGAGAALGAAQGNLIDQGGPVLSNARIYAIWWGKGFSRGAAASEEVPAVTGFLQGLSDAGGSTWLAVAGQYMRGQGVNARFMKAYQDSSTPPKGQPTPNAIVKEVGNVVSASGDSLDAGALYLVFTSNYPTGAPYCAWHSAGSVDGTWIAVGFMPNVTRAAGCAAPDSGSGLTRGTQALVNVTSHEVLEAITDSMLNDQQAWTDANGEEISDKCAWRYAQDSFGNYVTQFIGGNSWVLQRQWSNRAKACV